MSYKTTTYEISNRKYQIDRPLKARNILPKAKSERGYHSSLKSQKQILYTGDNISTLNILESESKLEYDFLLLLDHDPNCLDIQTQPVEWIYTTTSGRTEKFYPDIWALFHENDKPIVRLIEIKSEKKWKELNNPDPNEKSQLLKSSNWKMKLEVIRKECRKRGWIFQIITEKMIYCTRLENIKLCLSAAKFYSLSGLDINIHGLVERINQILKHRNCTIREIIDILSPQLPHIEQAIIISILKNFIYFKHLYIDWNTPLDIAAVSLTEIPVGPVFNLPKVFNQYETQETEVIHKLSENEKSGWLSDTDLTFLQPLIEKYKKVGKKQKFTDIEIRNVCKKSGITFDSMKNLFQKWRRQTTYEKRLEKIKPLIDKFGRDGQLKDILEYCTLSPPEGLGISGQEYKKGKIGIYKTGKYAGYPKEVVNRYRLYLQYKKNGLGSLWPKKRGKNVKSRLYPRIEELFQNTINKWYKKGGQKKAYYDIHFYHKCIKEKQQGLIPNDEKIPSYTAFLKRIKSLPATEKFGKYQPKRSIAIKKGRHGIFREGKYPGALIQIDHTRVDLWLVDEFTRKKTLIRPWITFAIDTFSRSIWSIFISYINAPNQETVMQCILNGIRKKNKTHLWNCFSKQAIEEGLDPEAFEWCAEGLPARIQVDNGKDFDAQAVKDLCMKLNITLSFRPVKTPEYGGFVESVNRTFNEAIHKFELDGRVFSLPKKRETRSSIRLNTPEGYNPKKKASHTFEEFKEFVAAYMVYYQSNPHSLQVHSPNDVWKQSISGEAYQPMGGKPRIINPDEYKIIEYDTKRQKSCILSEKGIRYENIFYMNEWLVEARRNRVINDGERIHFKVTDFDRRFSWTRDPDTGTIQQLTAYSYDGDDRIEKFILQGVGRGASYPFTISKLLLKKAIKIVKSTKKPTDATENLLLTEMMKKIKKKKNLDKFESKFLGELIMNREDEKLSSIIKLYLKTGQELTLRSLLESGMLKKLSSDDLGYIDGIFFGDQEEKLIKIDYDEKLEKLSEEEDDEIEAFDTTWEEASKDMMFWNIYHKNNKRKDED